MIKLIRRAWRYMTASLTGKFNEAADPKVQLEQAITEAQEQHRRLMEQAANVIANQKQNEMRLNRAMEDLQKVRGSATQALLMADDATKKGDVAKAQQYNQAAEAFAGRLIAVETEVESLKTLALQSTQAADQAKAAVQQNSMAMSVTTRATGRRAGRGIPRPRGACSGSGSGSCRGAGSGSGGGSGR